MKKYFYGHYFKLQSDKYTIAFIPSYSRVGKKYVASLQVITNDGSFVIDYDYSEYKRGKDFEVSIGNNHFRKNGIKLDINRDDIKLSGDIVFGDFNVLKKDIMGPFRFIPFMECRHQVVSIKQNISGFIYLNGTEYNFNDSYGYIEGDRGRSFPKVYVWSEALFNRGSVMLSVADIPFGLFHFTGIIGFVNYEGKTNIIGTYNHAKALKIKDNEVIIKQGKYRLYITLLEKNAFPLCAPNLGKMDRIVKESAECKVRYKYMKDNDVIFDITVSNASMEYEYIEKYEFNKLKK